tara:strand:- start:555 stop:1298 length:744 start_codon:yes stop_codon:yes gene_type:complete
MAYIGQSIKNGTFTTLDTSGNTYNGSNTAFALGTQVGSPAQLLVSHDGVIQKPGTDYTLSTGGTAITFTTAPASGASIFIVEISGAVGGPLGSDINGSELILDADGDSSLHADTDDQIDFKTGGTDRFVLSSANAKFNVGAYNAEATLTDASTISWDVSTSPVAKVTLAGNRTLGAGANPQTGQFISILFIQDGTGSRTVTFNAAYEFTEDTAPTLTTTAAKGDLFVFRYNGAKFLEVGRNLNLTLS